MAKSRRSSTSQSRKTAKTTKSAKPRRSTSKRDRVSTQTDTRYMKRTAKGRFKDSDDAGRAQRGDKLKDATTRVRSGFGDQGDRKK